MTPIKHNQAYNVFLIVLLALLCVGGNQNLQYDTLGSLESAFPGEPSEWVTTGAVENTLVEADSVSIFPNTPKLAILAKAYPLEASWVNNALVKVSGTVSELGIPTEADPTNWTGAKQPSLFYLWFQNAQNKRIWVQHIHLLTRPIKYGPRTVNVAIPADVQTVHIGLLLRNAEAGYQLRSVTVDVIENTLAYKMILGLTILLAFVALIIFVWKLYRVINVFGLLILLSILAMIFLGIMASGRGVESFMLLIFSALQIAPDINGHPGTTILQNYGHILGFAALSFVAFAVRDKLQHSYPDTVFKLIFLALFTEAIQLHRIDRSPNIQDIMFDLAGVAIGFVAWLVLARVITCWVKGESGKLF